MRRLSPACPNALTGGNCRDYKIWSMVNLTELEEMRAEITAASAQELSSQAREMQGVINKFRPKEDEIV